MSMEALDHDEVLAIRFDEAAAGMDVASWCGGRLETGAGEPVVWVPTVQGPRPAELGDWVVQHPRRGVRVMSHVDFCARHAPAAG